MPCHDGFRADTVLSLLRALIGFPHPLHIAVHRGTYLHANREAIVQDAIRASSTHLMFIDSDVVFPPDGILRLLEHDRDIVGGAYNMKTLPPVTTIKMADTDGNLINMSGADLPRELFKCAAVPTGFMCLKIAGILGHMEPPLFDFGRRPDGQLVGEDVAFCERARAAGLEVWCDPTIPLGHVGDYLY